MNKQLKNISYFDLPGSDAFSSDAFYTAYDYNADAYQSATGWAGCSCMICSGSEAITNNQNYSAKVTNPSEPNYTPDESA